MRNVSDGIATGGIGGESNDGGAAGFGGSAGAGGLPDMTVAGGGAGSGAAGSAGTPATTGTGDHAGAGGSGVAGTGGSGPPTECFVCVVGEFRCSAGERQVCRLNQGTGCPFWGTPQPLDMCQDGATCDAATGNCQCPPDPQCLSPMVEGDACPIFGASTFVTCRIVGACLRATSVVSCPADQVCGVSGFGTVTPAGTACRNP